MLHLLLSLYLINGSFRSSPWEPGPTVYILDLAAPGEHIARLTLFTENETKREYQ